MLLRVWTAEDKTNRMMGFFGARLTLSLHHYYDGCSVLCIDSHSAEWSCMCTLGSIINLTKLNVIFCVYSLVSICSSAFFPHHRPLAAFFSPLVQLFVPTRLHAFPSATIASRYFPLYLLILVFFLPRSHISLLSCTQASSRAHAHTA